MMQFSLVRAGRLARNMANKPIKPEKAGASQEWLQREIKKRQMESSLDDKLLSQSQHLPTHSHSTVTTGIDAAPPDQALNTLLSTLPHIPVPTALKLLNLHNPNNHNNHNNLPPEKDPNNSPPADSSKNSSKISPNIPPLSSIISAYNSNTLASNPFHSNDGLRFRKQSQLNAAYLTLLKMKLQNGLKKEEKAIFEGLWKEGFQVKDWADERMTVSGVREEVLEEKLKDKSFVNYRPVILLGIYVGFGVVSVNLEP